MPLSMEVGLRPGHIVLDGDPAPPVPKGASSPQFSAHVCCDQTPGWIKIPLGTEVGLGPGHTVIDGDPVPLTERGTAASHFFDPCLLWPNGRPSQLLLSSCCTAHGRRFLYFTMGRPFPLRIAPFHEESGLTHGFLVSPESATQTHLDRFSRFCRAHDCNRQ